jgi:hypothetical protein
MSPSKKSINRAASDARVADRQQAEQFCLQRKAEGLFADYRAYGSDFFGLVLSKIEHGSLLAAQNEEVRAQWDAAFHQADPFPAAESLDSRFYDHPLGRRAETRMQALEAAHLAFLGHTAAQPPECG